jgi:hypothetical protein
LFNGFAGKTGFFKHKTPMFGGVKISQNATVKYATTMKVALNVTFVGFNDSKIINTIKNTNWSYSLWSPEKMINIGIK